MKRTNQDLDIFFRVQHPATHTEMLYLKLFIVSLLFVVSVCIIAHVNLHCFSFCVGWHQQRAWSPTNDCSSATRLSIPSRGCSYAGKANVLPGPLTHPLPR